MARGAAQDRLVEVETVGEPAAGRVPVGAAKAFRAYDPDQVLLMAPSLADWVPDGHLARFVSDLVDEALDTASERFGITLPLEDLIVSDPYASAIQKVVSGSDLGPVTVLGVPCEHLAFSQDVIDWQIWIEDGVKPVPRKLVITYKDEDGSPQYTAIFSDWDFQTKLPDFLFTFEPPAGASKVNVAEIKSEIQTHKSEGK